MCVVSNYTMREQPVLRLRKAKGVHGERHTALSKNAGRYKYNVLRLTCATFLKEIRLYSRSVELESQSALVDLSSLGQDLGGRPYHVHD